MYSPKISVLMPIFNAEKDLSEAIDSILNQSLQEWELIIVDDGSTDRSVSIVQSFSDLRIKLICLQKNGGIVRALNAGWDQAQGDWIARMDGDDLCANDRLEKQLALMQQEKLDICGSHWYQIDDEGKFVRNLFAPTNSDELVATLATTVPFAHGSVMLKKEFFALNHLRYTPGYGEDYRLWIECFEKGAKFGALNEHAYAHRIHTKSITHLQSGNQAKTSKSLRRAFVAHNQDACLNALGGLQRRFLLLSNLMQIHSLYLAYQYGKFFGSYEALLNMLGKARWYVKMRLCMRIFNA
jgi:glycosyltransferase involved in cell wall biosynthesis